MADQVILASQSPRRKRLLELVNLRFDIVVSNVPEFTRADLEGGDFAREMAERKARQVASQKPESLVIGADTIVAHKGEILGKPANDEDAEDMLNRLSDQTHEVITAVSLILSDAEGNISDATSFHERTEVVFGSLEQKEIREYIDTGGPMDKAGSYGIQDDWGALFVKEIRGDYYNVVGFPLHAFYQKLKSFAPKHVPHAI